MHFGLLVKESLKRDFSVKGGLNSQKWVLKTLFLMFFWWIF